MKKLPILFVVFFTMNYVVLTAQAQRGKIVTGVSSTFNLFGANASVANFNYATIKNKNDAEGYEEPASDKLLSINLSPYLGYFVIDNLALGLNLKYILVDQKDGEDGSVFRDVLLSAGPFVRYYMPTSKILPFFELTSSFGYVNSIFKYKGSEDNISKSTLTSFGGGFGLSSPLGEKVTFDVFAGYNLLSIKDKEENKNNDRTVVGSFGINIGFSIFLGSKPSSTHLVH